MRSPQRLAALLLRWEQMKLGLQHLHVGQRGFYSVERLQALDDYCRDTSPLRAFAVIIALPVPALVVAVGMEFIPLQNPLDGWKANYGLWLRFVVGNLCIGLGFIFQIRQLVPGLGLNKFKMFSIAVSATCCGLAFMMAVADLWVFPIPFSIVLVVAPYMTSLVLCFLAGIGKRPFQLNPNLWHQLLKQIYIILTQALLAIVYPAFGAVYTWLPPTRQTGFILVLPVLKLIMQNIVAWSSKHMEEYVPAITVFSVELFNALYVAKCMQKANSIFTYVAIVSINTAESVIAFRSMQKKIAGLDILTTQNHQGLIHTVVETCQQPGVLTPREGSFVRLRAPIAHRLSRKNSEILGRLSSMSQRNLDTEQDLLPSAILVDEKDDQTRESSHVMPTSQHRPCTIVPDKSTPEVPMAEKQSKSESSRLSKELLKIQKKHKLVEQSLKMFYECEYHVLIQYIECMIPIIYAIYMTVLIQLPSAAYYPETHNLRPTEAHRMIRNVLIYAAMEVAAFIALHFAIKRKFGFSPMYLLAFVAETQWMQFQGQLMVWYIFVLELTLDQFGVDFTLRFAWMRAGGAK